MSGSKRSGSSRKTRAASSRRFLESFFTRYVGYDFTAGLEEQLDLVSNHELDWKQVLRDFWSDFSGALAGIKDLRTTEVLDSLNELLGPHIFPAKEDGSNPRACPSCGNGQLSLKLGKFGAFIGCSNYPECKFTRTLADTKADGAGNGERPGVRVLGEMILRPGTRFPLRDGRFGAYVQQGDGEKPKRVSLAERRSMQAKSPSSQAIGLLSLPREIAKHPETKEPILAGIGRFGPYVQHGKTYANIGKDEDILALGGNRAIDLIVAKESGLTRAALWRQRAARRRGNSASIPAGGKVVVKAGRYGPYVNHGKINATLPRDADPTTLTLGRSHRASRRESGRPTERGGALQGRLLGEHPEGGTITVRSGRFGPYVNHGRINATLKTGISSETITLEEAIRLIEDKESARAPRGRAKERPKRRAQESGREASGETGAQSRRETAPRSKSKKAKQA